MANQVINALTSKAIPAEKITCKKYLYSSEIPHLFECLMSGLIHHQPTNHLAFLRNCLAAIKQSGGVDVLRWDSFIETDQGEKAVALGESPHSSRFTSAKKSAKKDKVSAGTQVALAPLSRRLVDTGRKSDLSQTAQIMLVYVGPVPSKGSYQLRGVPGDAEIIEAFSSGFSDVDDMEDERLREEILSKLFAHRGNKPVVLLNYPRNANQLQWLLTRIGGVSVAVFVDYAEETLRHRLALSTDRAMSSPSAINNAIETYKNSMLPVIHWLDRTGKLLVIEGKSDTEVSESLQHFFERQFKQRSRAGSSASLRSVERTEAVDVQPLTVPFPKQSGAKSHLYLVYVGPVPNYNVPRMFLNGKTRHLLDHTNAMEKLPSVHSLNDGNIVCLNFPSDRIQFEWFIEKFGLEVGGVMVVDQTEITSRTRMQNSHMQTEAVDEAVRKYKKNCLPIIHWFDRAGVLSVIEGEEDDAIVMKNVVSKIQF